MKAYTFIIYATLTISSSDGQFLSAEPDWIGEVDSYFATFGTSVSSAGDVNGDGFDDIIIGAPYYSNGESFEGAVFIYLGSIDGPSIIADFVIESGQSESSFGLSVASAGDINGDGYDDILIGAPDFDNGESDEGVVFLHLGSPLGPSLTHDWMAESDQPYYTSFGNSVSSAGDINNDGFDDVIIGAPGFDNPTINEGLVFAYYGSEDGLSSTPDWVAEQNQISSNFGYSVSEAGDINGDNYDDILIGAPYYDNGQLDEGAVFVYYGSADGLSLDALWVNESNQINSGYGKCVTQAGDVNNDGFDDILVGAHQFNNGLYHEGVAFLYLGSDSIPSYDYDWLAESNDFGGELGYLTGITGADINGNGFADIVAGSWAYDNEHQDEGRVMVYHNSFGLLPSEPNWQMEGNLDSAFLGFSVANAGDVNGDGFEDVLIGAPLYSNGQLYEGRAYLYFGNCPSYSFLLNAEICEGESYIFPNGTTSMVSKLDTSFLSTIAGCDSIIIVNLIVNSIYETSIDANICIGNIYTFPDGSTSDESIIQVSELSGINGCDSNIITNLQVNEIYEFYIEDSICDGDIYVFPDGFSSTTAIEHASYLFSSFMCDSVVYTNLKVTTIDTSVLLISELLTANQSEAEYQWMECNSGVIINDAINQSYSPSTSGDFSCIIYYKGCIDTTECVSFLPESISTDASSYYFNIYPNPSNGEFNVFQNNWCNKLEVINSLGEIVLIVDMPNIYTTIKMENYNDGVYFIQLTNDHSIISQKIQLLK